MAANRALYWVKMGLEATRNAKCDDNEFIWSASPRCICVVVELKKRRKKPKTHPHTFESHTSLLLSSFALRRQTGR